MRAIPPDQITIECMDCGRQSLGARARNAPADAVLHVVHCGCELPSIRGEPFYVDGEGERIDEPVSERAPRRHR
jgi:hypothetical protein